MPQTGDHHILLFATPQFAPALCEKSSQWLRDFLDRLYSGISAQIPIKVKVGVAVVDALPKPSPLLDFTAELGVPNRNAAVGRAALSDSGSAGYAYLFGDDVLLQLEEGMPGQIAPGNPPSSFLTLTLPWRRMTKSVVWRCSVDIPLANTIFTAGRDAVSMVFELERPAGDHPFRVINAADATRISVQWPFKGSNSPLAGNHVVLTAPLTPLTAPRHITDVYGNIIRQVSGDSENGSPRPASSELEAAITSYFKAIAEPQSAVSVWAIVGRKSRDAFQDYWQDPTKYQQHLKDAWTSSHARMVSLLRSMRQGARLYRVLGGGGGWGKRAGLISLDPDAGAIQKSSSLTSRPKSAINDDVVIPQLIGDIAKVGEEIQFYIHHIRNDTFEPNKLANDVRLWSLDIGTIPGTIDQVSVADSTLDAEGEQKEAAMYATNHFGALSEHGFYVECTVRTESRPKSNTSERQRCTRTKVDVPFSRLKAVQANAPPMEESANGEVEAVKTAYDLPAVPHRKHLSGSDESQPLAGTFVHATRHVGQRSRQQSRDSENSHTFIQRLLDDGDVEGVFNSHDVNYKREQSASPLSKPPRENETCFRLLKHQARPEDSKRLHAMEKHQVNIQQGRQNVPFVRLVLSKEPENQGAEIASSPDQDTASKGQDASLRQQKLEDLENETNAISEIMRNEALTLVDSIYFRNSYLHVYLPKLEWRSRPESFWYYLRYLITAESRGRRNSIVGQFDTHIMVIQRGVRDIAHGLLDALGLIERASSQKIKGFWRIVSDRLVRARESRSRPSEGVRARKVLPSRVRKVAVNTSEDQPRKPEPAQPEGPRIVKVSPLIVRKVGVDSTSEETERKLKESIRSDVELPKLPKDDAPVEVRKFVVEPGPDAVGRKLLRRPRRAAEVQKLRVAPARSEWEKAFIQRAKELRQWKQRAPFFRLYPTSVTHSKKGKEASNDSISTSTGEIAPLEDSDESSKKEAPFLLSLITSERTLDSPRVRKWLTKPPVRINRVTWPSKVFRKYVPSIQRNPKPLVRRHLKWDPLFRRVGVDSSKRRRIKFTLMRVPARKLVRKHDSGWFASAGLIRHSWYPNPERMSKSLKYIGMQSARKPGRFSYRWWSRQRTGFGVSRFMLSERRTGLLRRVRKDEPGVVRRIQSESEIEKQLRREVGDDQVDGRAAWAIIEQIAMQDLQLSRADQGTGGRALRGRATERMEKKRLAERVSGLLEEVDHEPTVGYVGTQFIMGRDRRRGGMEWPPPAGTGLLSKRTKEAITRGAPRSAEKKELIEEVEGLLEGYNP